MQAGVVVWQWAQWGGKSTGWLGGAVQHLSELVSVGNGGMVRPS